MHCPCVLSGSGDETRAAVAGGAHGCQSPTGADFSVAGSSHAPVGPAPDLSPHVLARVTGCLIPAEVIKDTLETANHCDSPFSGEGGPGELSHCDRNAFSCHTAD